MFYFIFMLLTPSQLAVIPLNWNPPPRRTGSWFRLPAPAIPLRGLEVKRFEGGGSRYRR